MITVPTPDPRPSLAVRGTSERLQVGRILCIGRNYAAHAVEMGGTGRELPFHFIKSPTALLTAEPVARLPFPPATADLHHEVELVVALGAGGRDVPVHDALTLVFGYAVGLDLTRRDRQAEAKQDGRPWAIAKDFDGSAVCGTLVPAAELGHPSRGRIRLDIGGAPRQDGDLDQMTWKVPELLAYLSTLMTLRTGDLIYTGTPAGVGPLVPGDLAVGRIDALPDLVLEVLTSEGAA